MAAATITGLAARAAGNTITVLPIEGGFSNENYAPDCGPNRWLLRKTPILTSHQSAHNLLREYRVNGERVGRHLPDLYALSADSRKALGGEMIDVLSDLHQLDWRALGLKYLGRPESFLERQIERWLAQYLALKDRHGEDTKGIATAG